MESVGQQLREARLRLGLSLEDVSASTRINVKKVAAIESDDISHFTSRFLYRSFVRQVGVAVRLSGDILERSLPASADQIPEPLVPGQTGAPVPLQVASLRPQRVRISRWVYSSALLIVMLVACSTLFAMWQNARTRTEASVVANDVPPKQPLLAKTAAATELSGKPTLAPAPEAARSDSDLHLQVSASAPTWVSVTSDGKQIFSGILQTAETKILDGHETARIRTGNAGGVQVVFNGRAIGALGNSGQVRTAVFSKNGYEILEPQARVDAMGLHVVGQP